jgi:hypothetical protein
MSAKKILLKSNLLKWYLEHGLEITKIYGFIPAEKAKIYEGFTNWVSDSRRLGDNKKEFEIKGEIAKVIGNSGYGSTIMDKTKHKNCKYVTEKQFNKLKNSPWFYDAEEYHDKFEVIMNKKRLIQNTPCQVGYGTLQDAKLKMLQFNYDCVDKYIDRSNYQLMQMDTDSSYMALAGETFEELVKPHMKEEFEKDKNNWFPRTDTPEHIKYDKRTPGLFKEEKSGVAMIALCSKTYYLRKHPNPITKEDTKDDKLASKGAQQKRNSEELSWNNYKTCLFDRVAISGENAGIRYVDHHMQVYKQPKQILNCIYVKGVVMDDGVHIRPLII